jgi:FMN reductase
LTKIAVVTGNPKPKSRTHGVATAVADAVSAALSSQAGSSGAGPAGARADRLDIDLIDYASRLFEWEDAELGKLTSEVADAAVAIFASPTYKASYTGLLKAFLDRYGSNGLAGVTAVPVMTGGWPGHLLSVEVHLRPVLVELGASVPARGLYVTEPELADVPGAVAKWGEAAIPLIVRSAATA